MKFNILCLLLFISFTLVFKYSSAQILKLTYDNLLECEEIVAQDTVKYYYEEDNGRPYYRIFPVNSNISFKTDLDEFFLHSSSSEILNNILTIYMTKQTFGLVIDVKIQIIGGKPITTINYWTVFPNETRTLKTEKVTLVLNKKEFKSGENVIGEVNIKFNGNLFDELAMKDKKASGEIDGCFNIPVNKLLKSRLN
jgi:hypothetical protein